MSRSKLHLFNPENDLALALGCRHYTPPPHAAQLHRAGALLPVWWAGSGDGIIAPTVTADDDAAWLSSTWGLKASTSLPDTPFEAAPWGWSEDARRQFIAAGVDSVTLPSDETLRHLRLLSHRRSSITILSALGLDQLLPEEVTDPMRALQLENESPGRFFKSPWSCSGRGVFCAQGLSRKALLDKTAGIIHRQGSVMVEHGYRKVAEFGALYECDTDGAKFRGLSMFLTEARGAYTGNIVAPQHYFFSSIDSLGLLQQLDDATRQLEGVLTPMITPYYKGWLGIDMMAYEGDDGMTHLNPCIELNLRMTMGVVAMKIADRISATRPMLMSWQRATATDNTTTLLKPREGFALTLTDLNS